MHKVAEERMIPCWTLNNCQYVYRGIYLWRTGTSPECTYIKIGESGNNSACVFVTVPSPESIESNDGRLLYVIPPRSCPDAIAVLRICDQSGYGGSWSLGEYAQRRCSKIENRITSKCEECGGTTDHNLVPSGVVEPWRLGFVLAEGKNFHVDYYNNVSGGGPEYLIAVRPCRFSIRRTGKLCGRSSVHNVVITPDGEITVSDIELDIKVAETRVHEISRW